MGIDQYALIGSLVLVLYLSLLGLYLIESLSNFLFKSIL
ncbi:hypothetical protein Hgul01_01143 [Herpetosiphon gulosus]|uniref:Uncharacterized protein n=1 Tax=Herpetosiphon gulosus TaxID=1973496 RepID=A0ABP9WVX1_9CHLR